MTVIDTPADALRDGTSVAGERRRRSNESLVPFLAGRSYWWYLLPGFALLTLIILVPLVWNIYLSFTDYRGIIAPEWTRSCTRRRRSTERAGSAGSLPSRCR